jgi:hypothetical protein
VSTGFRRALCKKRKFRTPIHFFEGAAFPDATERSMIARTGGCLCGAVRYAVHGEPYRYGVCHCADCRKESGSVFVVYAHWRREEAEVTGEVCTFRGRSFCPICGSRLFNLHEADIEVRIGSLDEAPTSLGPPNREGWIKRRERWLPPVSGADQSFEDPPPDGSC